MTPPPTLPHNSDCVRSDSNCHKRGYLGRKAHITKLGYQGPKSSEICKSAYSRQ